MNKFLAIGVSALVLAIGGLTACGGGDSNSDTLVNIDVVFPDQGGEQDTLTDEGTPADTLPDGTDANVPPDAADVTDAVDDVASEIQEDIPTVDIPVQDPGHPEDLVEDVPPVYNYCNSLLDCQPFEVCDLASGVCEERSSYKAIVGNEELFQFKPAEGMLGDFIVLDGARFMTSSTTTTVRADIYDGNAKTLIAGTSVLHSKLSAHRILGVIPTVGGEVSVVFQQASPNYQHFPDPFTYNSTVVMDCDNSTPPATGTNGSLGEVGPFAAGYVDFVVDEMRIYYPAECGSIRRPGVPGTYPVLVIIPEGADTNFPFINFDYIGQMLATWGIVTVSISAEVNTEDATAHLARVKSLVPGFMNMDLGARHSAMTGMYTSDKMAYLVFGSGADTLNQAMSSEGGDALKNKTVAAIAMAPSAKLNDCGAPNFMALFGPNDLIANNSFANGSYDNYDSPKWKVQVVGGNHSLFTDHQIYYGGGYMPINDGEPSTMRKDQMNESMSMILPFLQMAFGLDQPFADQLKNSFNSGKVIVTKG